MNIDRGKETFSPEEVKELQSRLDLYREVHGHSWKSLAAIVEVPAGTLSQWVPDKYQGDKARVAYLVNKFFLSDESRRQLELEAPEVPSFQLTRTSRRIIGQLQWGQRGKFVVICGKPGLGKTAAITQYEASNPNVWVATCSVGSASPTGMLVEILRALGDDRGGFGGVGGMRALTEAVVKKVSVPRGLLVLDEAQRLSDLALEQLRYIHDRTGVGVALAGNPTVLTRIQGGVRAADFAQLASRVSLPAVYDQPDPEDIAVMLDAWSVEHARERDFMTKVAAQPGSLRNLTMTLELATLIARQDDEPRTLDHMKTAWQQHRRQPVAA